MLLTLFNMWRFLHSIKGSHKEDHTGEIVIGLDRTITEKVLGDVDARGGESLTIVIGYTHILTPS